MQSDTYSVQNEAFGIKGLQGYELLETLGQGGFGTVYRAKQVSTGQIVALKILRLDDVLNEQHQRRQIERFERETKLCAELNHPHIVQLLDKGQTSENQLYAVFEYVPGETLKGVLLRKGMLSAAEAGELMGQVLDALTSAHAKGVVHRDLKPHNIMITTTGTRSHAKVLDFGIGAFTPDARQADYKSLTLTQEALGTPSYSAPEQLRGEPPTVKSDLYAWGLVFIECLTGKPAMHGATLAEIFHKQLSPMDVPLPAAIIGHPVANVLRRVLQKNPRDRAAKAASLYNDFKQINLSNIVGDLRQDSDPDTDDGMTATMTIANDSLWGGGLQRERRQITVLCCHLSVIGVNDHEPDLEALEAIQRDQLSSCSDTASRFGGYLAGMLGDSMMVYFGYPQVSDNDARRAARTALELAGQIQRRSALLESQQGIALQFRIGMHTGLVLTNRESLPSGFTPNIAMRLEHIAPLGAVLVSDSSRRLLEQHIEFEPSALQVQGISQTAVNTHLLISERRAEALSFLRMGSASRTMVGRERELETLQALWEQSKAGQGRVALLTGEAGIGKSRLMYELRSQVRTAGYLSRDCRCLPEHKHDALYPILAMLKHYLNIQDNVDPQDSLQRLAELLAQAACEIDITMPIICAWLSLPIPEGFAAIEQSPDKQKQILIEALSKIIIGLADSQPYLLIVEDIHWIDPTSMEFLESVVGLTAASGIFLLLSSRPGVAPEWAGQDITQLNLERLSPTDAEAMIQKVVGEVPVDRGTLSKLSERTDGVPLFVEEFTRMLLDNQVLMEHSGVYKLSEELDSASIPITLRDSLNERLNRLGPVKETAQLAAAIGREFDYKLLSNASLKDEASLQADLEQILAADLIYRQRHIQGESYIFRHALIRDAAYDTMPRELREQAHARLAATLEDFFPELVKEQPAEVARHYAGAAQYQHAISFGTLAAQSALSLSVNQETVALSEQLLEWNELSTEAVLHKQKTELQINSMMFPALMALEGLGSDELVKLTQRSDELYQTLEQHGEEYVSEVNANTNYLSQWILFQDHHFRARRADAIALGERIIAAAQQAKHRQRELLVLPLLGQAYHLAGDLQAANDRCQRAITLYKDDDIDLWKDYGVEPKSQAQFLQSHVLCCLGFPDQAYRVAEESLHWAKKTGCSMSADGAILFSTLVACLCGDIDKVNKNADFYSGLQASTENEWIVLYWRVLHDWANNKLDHAWFVDSLLESGRSGALGWWEALLADTEKNLGHADKAIGRINSAIARCKQEAEPGALPMLERVLAQAYYQQAQQLNDNVHFHFNASLDESKRQGAKWLALDAAYHYNQALLESRSPDNINDTLGALLAEISEGHDSPLYQAASSLFFKASGMTDLSHYKNNRQQQKAKLDQ